MGPTLTSVWRAPGVRALLVDSWALLRPPATAATTAFPGAWEALAKGRWLLRPGTRSPPVQTLVAVRAGDVAASWPAPPPEVTDRAPVDAFYVEVPCGETRRAPRRLWPEVAAVARLRPADCVLITHDPASLAWAQATGLRTLSITEPYIAHQLQQQGGPRLGSLSWTQQNALHEQAGHQLAAAGRPGGSGGHAVVSTWTNVPYALRQWAWPFWADA